jgi:hypothetical protein
MTAVRTEALFDRFLGSFVRRATCQTYKGAYAFQFVSKVCITVGGLQNGIFSQKGLVCGSPALLRHPVYCRFIISPQTRKIFSEFAFGEFFSMLRGWTTLNLSKGSKTLQNVDKVCLAFRGVQYGILHQKGLV